MTIQESSGARDPQLIDRTIRLVEFLRDLATARTEQVRDVARYEQVYWLAERPAQAVLVTDAEPGQVVISLDPPPAEPSPALPGELDGWVDRGSVTDATLDAPPLKEEGPVEVTEVGSDGEYVRSTRIRPVDDAPGIRRSYERWLPEWQAWAAREFANLEHRRWYRNLLRLATTLSQREDEFEFVLASGLLTWVSSDGVRVHNHLLCTRVQVLVDADTQRVAVQVADPGSTRLEDLQLLDGLAGFEASRVGLVHEQVRGGEGVGLQPSVPDLLKEWCDRALYQGAVYIDDLEVGPPTAAAEVRFAPALVLRRRDRASLIAYYEEMLRALTGPDAAAPLGLVQLVTELDDEDLAFLRTSDAADSLFPLPANPQQREIMTKLRGTNGVVVQGPPGTGKTHTVANLISALLAGGQRVLVTSQKAQALRVLRDKLPNGIANLCVSMTDLGRGGSAELEGSVKALSNRFAGFDPEAQARKVERLRGRLAEARRVESTLTDRIRSLREAETYEHDEIAPGYQGTLAAIAATLKRNEPECGWLPVPLPEGAPDTPVIGAAEAGELLALLAGETPQRAARTSQVLPDPSSLPPAETVRALIAGEAAAADVARRRESDLSRRLGACDKDTVDRLEAEARTVARAIEQLDLDEDPRAWNTADWAVAAIVDFLARRESMILEQLASYRSWSDTARGAVRFVGLREVTLPPGNPAELATAARGLRDHLAGGGKLRRGPVRPAVQREAETLLDGVRVDGVAPTSVELLDVVIAELDARGAVAMLDRGWRLAGVALPPGRPLQRAIDHFGHCYERLARVGEIHGAILRTRELLTLAGARLPLSTPALWHSYASSLHAVRLRVEAERATAVLEDAKGRLEVQIRNGQAPPELTEAAVAIGRRDAVTYERCLHVLAQAHPEQRQQARCDELRARVRAAHPALAALMGETCRDDAWPRRLGAWDRAWAWARARTFFTAQRRPGLEQELAADLEAATKSVLETTAQLAAEQAWQACLSRMNTKQAQALRAYQSHMGSYGKGTGRYASRYRKLATEAMAEATPAVPAWVMPLPQVLETIPPERDSFDVVIVDEASQAGIEALFLLWLAPRVIVVGDDKQCAPSAVSHGELEPLFAKLATYLPDMPGYLRDAFTPNSSLYGLLSTHFGSVIPLREHFRCMPEIIGYSSRQFYADRPLIPLRQFGADRLPPLRVVRVHGASAEGTSTRLRNEVEATAIVERIAACIDDPAYDGRSFGVVVLQGRGQVNLIHTMLLERLDPGEWERRRLRVGTPPDFQGDERDVVFLSMVIADRRAAFTRLELQRRFNVAASRAKDQMWLFHSVSPDLLSPVDLRRSFLTYMQNPPSQFAEDIPDGVTPDIKHPDFDSLFEQRVFLRIRERGYHVVPQVEINGRRIDLVVTGAKGRLAVECDGDFWHASPEERENDLDRERELGRAGWSFWRVRESEFTFDPEAALASLWKELDRRDIHPGEVTEKQARHAPGWSAIGLPDQEGWDGFEDGDPREID